MWTIACKKPQNSSSEETGTQGGGGAGTAALSPEAKHSPPRGWMTAHRFHPPGSSVILDNMKTNFTSLTLSGKILTWTNKWPELGKHVPDSLVFSFTCFIRFISISTAPLPIISWRNSGFPEMNLMVPMQYRKASVLACRSSLLRTSNNDSVKKMNYYKCMSRTAGEREIKALGGEHQIWFVKCEPGSTFKCLLRVTHKA